MEFLGPVNLIESSLTDILYFSSGKTTTTSINKLNMPDWGIKKTYAINNESIDMTRGERDMLYSTNGSIVYKIDAKRMQLISSHTAVSLYMSTHAQTICKIIYSDGFLYVCSKANKIAKIDVSTMTNVGEYEQSSSTFGSEVLGIEIDHRTRTLYNVTRMYIYKIDGNTMVSTADFKLDDTAYENPTSMTLGADGFLYISSSGATIMRFNPTTMTIAKEYTTPIATEMTWVTTSIRPGWIHSAHSESVSMTNLNAASETVYNKFKNLTDSGTGTNITWAKSEYGFFASSSTVNITGKYRASSRRTPQKSTGTNSAWGQTGTWVPGYGTVEWVILYVDEWKLKAVDPPGKIENIVYGKDGFLYVIYQMGLVKKLTASTLTQIAETNSLGILSYMTKKLLYGNNGLLYIGTINNGTTGSLLVVDPATLTVKKNYGSFPTANMVSNTIGPDQIKFDE